MGVDFVSIRKGKGRIHLAVAVAPGQPVDCLCDKAFGPGEVAVVEQAPDCQACLRRSADPGRVSSALFAGGRGSALLEMSLQQARERHSSAQEAPSKPTRRMPAQPHLTIVPSERPEHRPRPAPEQPPPTPAESLAKPAAPEATALSRGLYRTPGGVVIRVGVHVERARLERRRGDRVRIVAGDVDIDVPPTNGS